MNFHLTNLVSQGRFLKIGGVDFNGKDFDGSPLDIVALSVYTNRPVVREQLIGTNIAHITARGYTDYAWFGVADDYDNITWAGPGDFLYQLEPDGKKYVVVPAAVMELLLQTGEVAIAS